MAKARTPFAEASVEAAFNAFDDAVRDGLLDIREMIFAIAASIEGVGPLLETLKWGQPSYLTPTTNSGSTLRLGASRAGKAALYAHCQTRIISDFASLHGAPFEVEGTRAVHVPFGEINTHRAELGHLITSALTYHQRA